MIFGFRYPAAKGLPASSDIIITATRHVDREDLTASEVLEYEDKILALIQKEKLPSEGERGLAVYFDDDLSRKVYSIHPSAEEWTESCEE